MKTCTICKKELLLSNFYFITKNNCYHSECKKCTDISSKKSKSKNIPYYKNYYKNYDSEHKEEIKIRKAQQYLKNKAKIDKRNKQYDLEHKEEKRIRSRKYEKQRREKDINYKIIKNLRCRVWSLIKGYTKSVHTIDLLMCSIPELKLHIESLWLPGMNWDNYGFGNDKWNIDHIIPCSFFQDYINDPVEQYMCFRWQNIQPLWQVDNFKKSDKI